MNHLAMAIGVGLLMVGCSKNTNCVTHECEVQTDNQGFAKLPEANKKTCSDSTTIDATRQFGTDPHNEFIARCGKLAGHYQ